MPSFQRWAKGDTFLVLRDREAHSKWLQGASRLVHMIRHYEITLKWRISRVHKGLRCDSMRSCA